ncbi:DUF4244 domain-containing protein [Kitasatospora sp. NPDC052896]|uniref:DUF4244 domain-containing protein n=1 Tax=Kitasatospora sp. NPDC052896 TaxID=3364061 RepID=UPI0037CC0F34
MKNIAHDSVSRFRFIPFPSHEHAEQACPGSLAPAVPNGGVPLAGWERQRLPRHRPAREVVRRGMRRLPRWVRRRLSVAPDAGMSTAEYAIGTVAACGFAALLYKVLTGGTVSDALTELVNRALHVV